MTTGHSSDPAATFLTENQLAARHQCSVRTLRNLRNLGGGIAFVKLGRLVRYRLSDVEAWEQAHLRRSTFDVASYHG
jgi:predicted DNA-binding transcriptional regulator AlpA